MTKKEEYKELIKKCCKGKKEAYYISSLLLELFGYSKDEDEEKFEICKELGDELFNEWQLSKEKEQEQEEEMML